MKSEEVKLVYVRGNGNEEEAYLKGDEQNVINIFDSVRKLFNLGCRSVSLETQEISILFESEPGLGGKAIQGRFKQGYRIVK
jgi:hypothetical protein